MTAPITPPPPSTTTQAGWLDADDLGKPITVRHPLGDTHTGVLVRVDHDASRYGSDASRTLLGLASPSEPSVQRRGVLVASDVRVVIEGGITPPPAVTPDERVERAARALRDERWESRHRIPGFAGPHTPKHYDPDCPFCRPDLRVRCGPRAEHHRGGGSGEGTRPPHHRCRPGVPG